MLITVRAAAVVPVLVGLAVVAACGSPAATPASPTPAAVAAAAEADPAPASGAPAAPTTSATPQDVQQADQAAEKAGTSAEQQAGPPATPAATPSTTTAAPTDADRERIYLTLLDNEKIIYSSAPKVVALGRAVCSDRANGIPRSRLVTDVMDNSDFDAYQAGYIVGAAEGSFCPSLAE